MTWLTLKTFGYLIFFIHALGILSAIEAIYLVRSAQGALAWSIVLILYPYISLPLYWVFGRTRFKGYYKLIKSFKARPRTQQDTWQDEAKRYATDKLPIETANVQLFEQIAQEKFTGGNNVELLIDGDTTFSQIISGISAAQSYVLLQFFIIRDDEIGQRVKAALCERARAGVKVLVLYDEIGSAELSSEYVSDLQQAGVQITEFSTRRGRGNFFQFNFRNHRKLVVIDGQLAFVGGLNIGDEYLGKSKSFGSWRDTSLMLSGPVVLSLQTVFATDWNWATNSLPDVVNSDAPYVGKKIVLNVATGPSDENDRCALLFLGALNSAKKRIWISTPYFVPSESVMNALELAVLRGVDVRLLLPLKYDHLLAWYASYFYTPTLALQGVKIFRYNEGFLHQKALLVDDALSILGTVNFDNRSFHLNFEVSLVIADKEFAESVAGMLEADFSRSIQDNLTTLDDLPWWRRFLTKFARLFSPIL